MNRLLVIALALVLALPGVADAHFRAPFARGWLVTGDGPALATLDPTTHTLYVTNRISNTVSVLDTRCHHACHGPAVPIGNAALGIELDARTRTLYVVNSDDGTLSVIDAATCNAVDASGCGKAPTTVAVEGFPFGLAIDQATDTIYVGNAAGDALLVYDAGTCNRTTSVGCAAPVAHAHTVANPTLPFVNPATRTLYVAASSEQPDPAPVSVIDVRACNAHQFAACGHTPPTLTAGPNAGLMAFDDATGTVYIDNSGDHTVSVVDGTTCNGSVTYGCGNAAATTHVGPTPGAGLVVDPGTRTLYEINSQSDTIAAIDIRTCGARNTSGCGRRWPTLQTGNVPNGIVDDPATGMLLVSDFLDDSVIALDPRSCNAHRNEGCRDEAPMIALDEAARATTDPAVHTAYVSQPDAHRLAMVDTGACSAHLALACVPVLGPVPGVSRLFALALDAGTGTMYATDLDNRTVVLLDPARCNVTHPAGCAPVGPPVAVGAGNGALAVDTRTHAVYVANAVDGTVSAIDGAHCNIHDFSRCVARSGAVGRLPLGVAVDPATSSVYVSSAGDDLDGTTVAVIDGARCCAVTATVDVGRAPWGVGVDPALRTLYVANQAFGDEPGSVSLVNTRTCNARRTEGCSQTPPRVATGLGPTALLVDPLQHMVFTADIANATVTIIDGAACNALHADGCRHATTRAAVGFFPVDLALDDGTLYVVNSDDHNVSLVDVE